MKGKLIRTLFENNVDFVATKDIHLKNARQKTLSANDFGGCVVIWIMNKIYGTGKRGLRKEKFRKFFRKI